MNVEWAKVKGAGKVYSYVITHQPFGEEWRDEVPYVVAIVELDDVPTVRLLANMVDCKPEDVKIGMPVEVVFDDVTERVTLPRFKPVRQ